MDQQNMSHLLKKHIPAQAETVLDSEQLKPELTVHTNGSKTAWINTRTSITALEPSYPILNPDKDKAMEIIGDIYDKEGCIIEQLDTAAEVKLSRKCPCKDLLMRGHCPRGLFVKEV